jgi:hypothetical protein
MHLHLDRGDKTGREKQADATKRVTRASTSANKRLCSYWPAVPDLLDVGASAVPCYSAMQRRLALPNCAVHTSLFRERP